MKRLTGGYASLALAALAASAGFSPAQAQPADVSELIVTGSRIRTSRWKRPAVVNIDQEAIAKTGLTSTVDVLQRIPSASGGLNSKFNNSGNLGNPPDGGGVGAGSLKSTCATWARAGCSSSWMGCGGWPARRPPASRAPSTSTPSRWT